MPMAYYISYLHIVFYIVYSYISHTIATLITVDHCSSERFSVQCSSQSELLFIHKALYGRMRPGRCVSTKYTTSIGCQTDVTSDMIAMCSGRANCSIPVNVFDARTQPCELDFKSYLETTYECAPVSFLDECRSGNVTRLKQNSGYLALFPQHISTPSPTDRFSPASRSLAHCHWSISVDPGMVIDVTWKVLPQEEGSSLTDSCSGPLLFREGPDNAVKPGACRPFSHPRSSFVHTSQSSSLEIHLTETFIARHESSGYWKPYVLQFKASGCADFNPPEGAEAVRNGDDVIISCDSSLQKWNLHCDNGQWYGMVGNCTKSAQQNIKRSGVTRGYEELKHGVLLAVSVGIVLGVLVGAILMFFIFIVKRSRDRSARRTEMIQGSTLCDVYKNKSCRCPALFVRDRMGVGGVEGGIGPLYEYTYACSTTDEAMTTDTGLDLSCEVTSSSRHLKLQSLSHEPDLYGGYGSTVSSATLSGVDFGGKPGEKPVILCDLDRIEECKNQNGTFSHDSEMHPAGTALRGQCDLDKEHPAALTYRLPKCCLNMSHVEHCACGRSKAIGSLPPRCVALPNIVQDFSSEAYQAGSLPPA